MFYKVFYKDKAVFKYILAVALVLCSACSSAGNTNLGVVETATQNEMQERQDIFDIVKRAIDSRDFAKLNAMELEYRSRRSLTPSGTWKLSFYYAGLSGYLHKGMVDGECVYTEAPFLKAWTTTQPDAPAAYIVEAHLLERNAWCNRGSGYAKTVSDGQMIAFKNGIRAARQVLEKNKAAASVDPHYYAIMADIYIADAGEEFWPSATKSGFKSLMEEATEKEPYYYDFYFRAYRFYLSRWYGNKGDIDSFARMAADKTAIRNGIGTYARIYWFMSECDCGDENGEFDWPTLKTAMDDVISRYPNDWNAANFAKFSCENKDGEAARKYFNMMQKDDASLWDNKGKWYECRLMASLL
jgi:hypothetical protein